MMTKEELHKELKYHFGFDSFKGNQEDIIMNVLAGNDTFVLMPTGGGKSLCYQLPSLIMDGTAIVISPLIALMKNQVDAMRNFSEERGIAHFLNSSLSKAEVDSVKTDILEKRTKLLYVAPESLTKDEYIEFLQNVKISFYAVDEAHCISEWGHDFRQEYRNIRPIIDRIGQKVGVIALTATATPKVQHDIQKSLGMKDAKVFKSSFNRSNLYYEVKPKTKDVDKDLIKFIRANHGKSGIIYCLSRKQVEDLAETLNLNGIKARAYHAGMDATVRSANQDDFLLEKVDVIVATIAFGMGIDKPDVRYVIHYDIPKSLEGYYQETGRAGRDGGEGKCIAYYCEEDLKKLEKFTQSKNGSEKEIGKQLLAETQMYATTTMCRRKVLLHYFGEEYVEDNCGNCDNCLNPKKTVEAKELLSTVLETVVALGEQEKIDYVIDIILGRETPMIVELNQHEEIDTFGEGKSEPESTWQAVIQEAIVVGYLKKDVESYGNLKITPEGKKFLSKPKSFKVNIIDEDDVDDIDIENIPQTGDADSCAVDPELFSMLKDLRKKMANQMEIPPFVIFQDPALEAMATTYPINLDELANIPGVGQGKAKKFGKEFVDVIRRHVEENEIQRPEDFRIRTAPSKSKIKVEILNAIDLKKPLDEWAAGRGIEFDDLLTEIESIVNSGPDTPPDISYFIEQVMDEDRVEEIYDYFRDEAESDDIDSAIENLGGDYTEEEVRLVRIKFLTELGS
ncbi:MAG: DNA helicase RecQ [Paludibacteraceae bacterium]|jgi:ATP-dependent DNA helicase RecQ|nr:DNA helicase RecQ [Paludibacteraceae bacterium]MDD5997665.1 DNA helicase RecQ [Bacteroidales bacterium]MBR6112486.1 DNA helicase RecQ [Paludibacteraceae bacterium]MCR5248949.1 DNA helicase RecQ [Paludibacteraceae bacterium]MEE1062577.1 DNA helicase RecQ [Paludibacteraceae bacterium]